MPKTSAPQYSTYKTEQYGLVKDIFSRGNSNFDGKYLNCLIEEITEEKRTKQTAVVKRPGTTTALSSASITSTFRGIFWWEKQGQLLVVMGQTLYVYTIIAGSLSLTTSVSLGIGTSLGDVGMIEYQYLTTNEICVMFSDGVTIGKISTTYTITLNTDPDLPTPHNPRLVTLDGYLFVLKSGTADLYNSKFNDPLVWNSEYITAEMSPDTLEEVIKMSNYVVGLGKNSIEFWYDAGNASGSPLSRNDTFFKNVGYIGGIAQLTNKVIFIGKELGGPVDLFMIEDGKTSALNNQQLLKYLNRLTASQIYAGVKSAIIPINGKVIYLITIGTTTFAVDPVTQNVTQFSYKATSYFPTKYFCIGKSNQFGLINFVYNDVTNELISFDPTVYTDSGTSFTFQVRTDPQDLGTMQMKFIGRLSLFADSGDTSATISLRWSDDDYVTWSNSVGINLNQELPSVRRLGGFRRRAFEFSNTSNQPIRLYGYELDLNMGSS